MKVFGHRHIAAKVMMAAAWCIIMLHSVVPHHHHDCCDGGLVFENELDCQCDHHNHDCDHHDGNCKLQDLLSQLVISTKEDKWLVVCSQWYAISGMWADILEETVVPELPLVGNFGSQISDFNSSAGYAAAAALRGPPVCC